jgi:hypothetical protein
MNDLIRPILSCNKHLVELKEQLILDVLAAVVQMTLVAECLWSNTQRLKLLSPGVHRNTLDISTRFLHLGSKWRQVFLTMTLGV